ncbi:SagB-type dehydrogenase domain [Actinomyces howellii]|uniref:SagB-type dehydrogenase domain n=1 Tax=Actinomyces howellii TaxID=52771 RepID=A0A3S4UXW9_9ACTO|nr:SagB-type dehydrogenase domain [Actinomyces howellii]
MAGSVLRAGDLRQAARQDLQFRVPRRPVVRLGVRMRPDGESWVLDGAPTSQVMSGRFAREHLAEVLGACDGSRTIAEVGRAAGVDEDAAFQAVSLLWTGGIVEEGDVEPLDPPAPPELACLLSRLGDSTGVNDSWQDAARRLRRARVVVLGDPEVSDLLAQALAPTLEARTAPEPQEGDTLAVVVETRAGAEDLERACDRCWELGLPLLRVRAEHEAVTIGPYVDPGFSPCPRCALAGEEPVGPAPGDSRRELVAGLAGRAVSALVSRAALTHLPTDVRRTVLADLTVTDRPVVSLPGCPRCSVSEGPVAREAPLGARYEQSVAIPPAAFVDAKGHQQHYASSNLRLQHAFRRWPVCPRTPLPPADLEALEVPWETGIPLDEQVPAPGTGRLDAGRLATILALAAGLREPLGGQEDDTSVKTRRWTAAGGNIGSVTAYVLVGEHGPVEPGAYVYVERDHVLAPLGPAPRLPGEVGARLVLTGDIAKVARKYRAFALRVVIQDCGCAAEVVDLVARALEVEARAHPAWDEQELAAVLGADPGRETVCAVIDLGGRDAL